MHTLIDSLNAGNFNGIVFSLAYLVMSRYSAEIAKDLISWITTGLHYMSDRASQQQNQFLADVEQRFLSKVETAVQGMAPMADELAKLTQDGELTQEDRNTLMEDAFKLFMNGLTSQDWISFGKYLILGYSGSTQKDMIKSKMKEKFIAHHQPAFDSVHFERRKKKALMSAKTPEDMERALILFS